MKDSLKLENQLCFVIYALSREITKMYRPILDTLGLTYTQFLVMIVLWEKDGIALRKLGQKLNLDSGTLTPLLKKLENEGLIIRRRDDKDERNLIIHLTKAGQELMNKAEDVPGSVACKLPLEESEIVYLREKLKIVLNNIGDKDKEVD